MAGSGRLAAMYTAIHTLGSISHGGRLRESRDWTFATVVGSGDLRPEAHDGPPSPWPHAVRAVHWSRSDFFSCGVFALLSVRWHSLQSGRSSFATISAACWPHSSHITTPSLLPVMATLLALDRARHQEDLRFFRRCDSTRQEPGEGLKCAASHLWAGTGSEVHLNPSCRSLERAEPAKRGHPSQRETLGFGQGVRAKCGATIAVPARDDARRRLERGDLTPEPPFPRTLGSGPSALVGLADLSTKPTTPTVPY